jgi:hypothetical protein
MRDERIGQLADSSPVSTRKGGAVHVLIRLERLHPPVGTVLRVLGGDCPTGDLIQEFAFIGWLGLMRALSEVVGEIGD